MNKVYMKTIYVVIGVLAVIVFFASLWYQAKLGLLKREQFVTIGDYPNIYVDGTQSPCYSTSSPFAASSSPPPPTTTTWPSWATPPSNSS